MSEEVFILKEFRFVSDTMSIWGQTLLNEIYNKIHNIKSHIDYLYILIIKQSNTASNTSVSLAVSQLLAVSSLL